MNYALLFANNANTTLALPVLSTDLTLTVASGTGIIFPVPSTNQAIVITLTSATNPLITEIVLCTNITGDVLTVIRGQEGTIARAWSQSDYVSNLITAGTVNSFAQIYGLSNQLYSASFLNVSGNTGQIANLPINATDITNKKYVDSLVSGGLLPNKLTFGTGILGGSFNGSLAVTASIDETIIATLATTQTLTNKVISGLNNSISNIANSSLINDSITVNGVTALLGNAINITATTPQSLTPGTGLSGNSFNGGNATIWAISPTGVTSGSYGSSSYVPVFSVNAEGQITSASATAVTVPSSQITGLIANSQLVNNAITINGVYIPLGSSNTISTNTAFPLTFNSSGLGAIPNSTFNGSVGLTVSYNTIGASPLAGSSSITNVGTIQSGIWEGSAVSLQYGGTGASTAISARTNLGAASSGMNTDITSLTALLGVVSSPSVIQFATGVTPSPLNAGMLWFNGSGNFNVQLDSSVTANIARDNFIFAKASSPITLGQLVYYTGAVGSSSMITVSPAVAGLTNPNYIVGIAAESLGVNGTGLIQILGDISGFDTTGSLYGETWTTGDIIYYNPITGGLTHTYPTSGLIVTIAAVTNAGSGNSGSLLIRPSITQRLNAGINTNVIQNTDNIVVNLNNYVSGVNINLNAGTTTQTPLQFNPGVFLTSPIQGSEEFDGNSLYVTGNPTVGSGRQLINASQLYQLTTGGIVNSGAQFFSMRPYLIAGHLYEIEYNLIFTSSTNQTVTFNFNNSTLSNFNLNAIQTLIQAGTSSNAIAGMAITGYSVTAVGFPVSSSIYANGTAITTSPLIPPLIAGGTYIVQIKGSLISSTNTRLQLLLNTSAGTITSLVGSYCKVTDLGNSSIGNLG